MVYFFYFYRGTGVNGLHPGGDLKKKHLVRRQVWSGRSSDL